MVTISIVGATGRVGAGVLKTLLAALSKGQISHLRILTSSPSKVTNDVRSTLNVTISQISYSDPLGLEKALKGSEILISVMGTGPTNEGEYETNKAILIEAAVKAGVKVYAPSEFGTDHNTEAAKTTGSPMFENKREHHLKAESLGLQVCALYTGLILEGSFSDWLNLDSNIKSPTWKIPKPAHPVAFYSLDDVGTFVLSATLQKLAGKDIPSRLRVYSDCLPIEEAAKEWEKATGNQITRAYTDTEELRSEWDAFKKVNASSRLGPAIPLIMSLGGFDHSKENHNALLLTGEFARETKKVRDQFASLQIV